VSTHGILVEPRRVTRHVGVRCRASRSWRTSHRWTGTGGACTPIRMPDLGGGGQQQRQATVFMSCAGSGPPPPTAAHRGPLPPTDRLRAHRRAPPSCATVVPPIVVAVAFFRPARGRQAMEDEVGEDELELASVLGARACFGARRARLDIRSGHVRKRVGGSRRWRRPNRQRDFDLGALAILRDHVGVEWRPPVYGEDEFSDRFRIPRPAFNRLFRAIYELPFCRRTVNATGRPQAHAIQKVAAALRVLG